MHDATRRISPDASNPKCRSALLDTRVSDRLQVWEHLRPPPQDLVLSQVFCSIHSSIEVNSNNTGQYEKLVERDDASAQQDRNRDTDSPRSTPGSNGILRLG